MMPHEWEPPSAMAVQDPPPATWTGTVCWVTVPSPR